METLLITVPSLNSANRVVDLGAALLGLSGVEHVDMDDTKHTVSVVYDPAFADRETISQIIIGAGYPSRDRTP